MKCLRLKGLPLDCGVGTVISSEPAFTHGHDSTLQAVLRANSKETYFESGPAYEKQILDLSHGRPALIATNVLAWLKVHSFQINLID